MNKKVILIILDGFGASALEEGNAILGAKIPFLDYCFGNFPKTLLHASGEEVGLSWGEMGNSEVGHINIGTGRIGMQDLPRINATIEDKSFYTNEYFIDICNHVKKNKSILHCIGLLSNGCVHADIGHLQALVKMAKMHSVARLAIHVFTDGRDMPKKSSEKLFEQLEKTIKDNKVGILASICGRYYAMDRDQNWDRTKKAYELISSGQGKLYNNYKEAIMDGYANHEDDENLSPILLNKNMTVNDNDGMIFFNFRSDRAKQIAETFINEDFNKFVRSKFAKNVRVITFTSYGNEQTPLIDVAYLEKKIINQLAQIIDDSNLKQFHIAESEKYAHVTYFFNGGVEKPYKNEFRKIISSPKIKSYDLKPEMSCMQVTDEFIKYFKKNQPDFSVVNYANPDMVGHTGNYKATIKAIEKVDNQIFKLIANVKDINTSIIITADHGNAEQMINPDTKDVDKQHTTNSVPYCYLPYDASVDKSLTNKIKYEEKIGYFGGQPTGVLADISPTILTDLGISKPQAMNGISLKNII